MSTSFIGGDSFSLISSGSGGGGGGGAAVIILGAGSGSSDRCGANNTASGTYSFVAGECNSAISNYSVVVGGQCNTACGLGSFVGGGLCNNTNGNACGFIGGGYCNTASGIQSMAIGAFSVADSLFGFALGRDANVFSIIGRQTYASGSTSVIGDAQKSTFVLRAATTGVTATSLTTDGSGTALSTNQVILSNQASYRFKGSIVGKQSGSVNVASWDIDGLIVRGANAAATTLNIANVNLVQNTPAWGTPTLAADTTNGGLRVQCIGAAATNIQWTCTIETTEVIYA
jgi:hypothetical protein